MAGVRAGRGSSGVPKGGQLERDLKGMSNSAKRKRREKKVASSLDAAFAGKKSKHKPRSATGGMGKARRATYYEKQAAKNFAAAKKVTRSGTGNKKAAETFTSVAEQYKEKARKLRSK